MRSKHSTIIATILTTVLSAALNAAVTATSDTFDTNTGTFPNWVHAGPVTTGTIAWDSTSANDYYDGDDTQYLTYTVGMALKGDGLYSDGGLWLNTFNGTPGDEALGLTIGGTMDIGEQIALTGTLYNDNTSYTELYVELWNLTDNVLLASNGAAVIRASNYNWPSYIPVDFNVQYTAQASDVGDILQIRFRDYGNSTARDIYVDNFALTSTPRVVPLSLFIITN
jgi:hypothetical protein